jgi:Ser/Thr protein kinase RdoA (MazF antagonist)
MALVRYGLTRTDEQGYADREAFPAQSSVLDEKALLFRVLPQYPVSDPLSCRFLERGDADIYQVVTRGPRYYLKVYRPPHSPAAVESEGRLLAALDSLEIPVVLPIPRHDGGFTTVLSASEGLRPAVLFEEAPPSCPRPSNSDSALRLGVVTACLHQAMDRLSQEFAFPKITSGTIGDLLPHAKPFVGAADYAFLEQALASVRPQLAQLPQEAPSYGLCHADLPANLRHHDERGLTFFDFGEAAYTWRMTDYLALQSYTRRGNQQQGPDMEEAFRAGYQRVLPLPAGLTSHHQALALAEHIAWIGRVCASCQLRMGTDMLAGFLPDALTEARELARLAA